MKNLYLILLLLIASFRVQSQKIGPYEFKVLKNLEATEVKSQDQTGTCWSFSATSFLEAEVLRKSGQKLDLSEMFVVRKIYLEKAINYLRYHGKANFSQGALAHDQLYAMKKYGLMPEEIYSGKKKEAKHNHAELEKELNKYLDSVLAKKVIDPHWMDAYESILDRHLGSVKPVFTYKDVVYNPMTFAASLDINPEDYQGFTSYTHHPFHQNFILEIPDNFSRGEYTNVPLDQLIEIMETSINQGFTVEWDGDVGEPGFLNKEGIAILLNPGEKLGDTIHTEIVPTQELRQSTFDSHLTTDDHLMHITGIATDQRGTKYFIVKNSWGKSAGIDGYFYMSENYMRLKTVSIFVHKKAIPPIILHFLEKH